MSRETLCFTIIDAETQEEKKVLIDFGNRGPTPIYFPDHVILDNQQAAELGYLLVALSRDEYDRDSVDELLEGFGFKMVEYMQCQPEQKGDGPKIGVVKAEDLGDSWAPEDHLK